MEPLDQIAIRKARKLFISFFEFLDRKEEEEKKEKKDGFFYFSPEGNRIDYDFDSDLKKVIKKVSSKSGGKLEETELSSAKGILAEMFAMITNRSGLKIEAQTLDLDQIEAYFKEGSKEKTSSKPRVTAGEDPLTPEGYQNLNKELFDAASKKDTPLKKVQALYDRGAQVNAPEGNPIDYNFDSDHKKVIKKVSSKSGGKLEETELSSSKGILAEMFDMITNRSGSKIEAQTLDLDQIAASFKEGSKEKTSSKSRVTAGKDPLTPEGYQNLNKELFDAASKKDTPLKDVQALWDKGAQVNASFPNSYNNRWSESALNKAVECGNYEVAEFLLENNADPNVPNNLYLGFFTPLHLAAARGDVKFVELLLSHKADYSQKNSNLFDPIEFMLLMYSEEDSPEMKNNVKSCLDLFKKNGADIEQAAKNIIEEGYLNEKEAADLQKLVANHSEKEIGVETSQQKSSSLDNIFPNAGSKLTNQLNDIAETLRPHLTGSSKETKTTNIPIKQNHGNSHDGNFH